MAAGFRVNIEFEGLAKPLAGLRNLRDLGLNLRPFMDEAAGILLASTIVRFDDQRGPFGVRWAPTKRQRTQAVGKEGPNKAGILVDTGDLRGSIRTEVTDNSVEIGSDGLKNPVKALANQFGSHRPTTVAFHTRRVTVAFGVPLAAPVTAFVSSHVRITNLPARPFIGIDDEDERRIEQAWQARLISTFGSDSNGRP